MASPSTSLTIPDGPAFDNITAVPSLWDSIPDADVLFLEARLVFTAVLIIFLGAHGALCRPPSASPPKRKDGRPKAEKKDTLTEGLVASDAIMFPMLAGCVLVGLYYLIKWLQDPAVLNKILRTYISVMGIASITKLFADASQVVTSFIFPRVWVDGKGQVFRFDQRRKGQWTTGTVDAIDAERIFDPKKISPFPGPASQWKLLSRVNNSLWEARKLLLEEWTLRLAAHGIGKQSLKLKLANVAGVVVGLAITYVYYVTESLFLANLIAWGTSYGAFMIMSCTSFSVGSLVLAGLFVYDIVMVFYTPFMITVATKIDAPIKLVFEGKSRSSLLGLGDIIIPGMFICLALRFDLWKFYQKQIKYVQTDLTTVTQPTDSELTTTTIRKTHKAVKAPFIDPQGRWGDRFWASSWTRPFSAPQGIPTLVATAFPKTYFYATMVGYTVGMLVTLTMLIVFRHGQPALLYLVPGVVGSAWLTGYLRGEIHDMWLYTEDGSLDTEEVVVELDGAGNVVKEIAETKATETEGHPEKPEKPDVALQKSQKSLERGQDAQAHTGGLQLQKEKGADKGYDVFLVSLRAPGNDDIEDEDE